MIERNQNTAERFDRAVEMELVEAQRIYFVTGDPLGDAFISGAYLSALDDALKQMGSSTPITLVINPNHHELFDSRKAGRIDSVISATPELKVEAAKQIASQQHERRSLIMDFEAREKTTIPVLQHHRVGDNQVGVIKHLLMSGLSRCDFNRFGMARFATNIEKLFSLHKRGIEIDYNVARPHMPLPNRERDLQAMIHQFGIDMSRYSMGVVVEGSFEDKRYSLDNWGNALAQIAENFPELNFLLMYHPGSTNIADLIAMLKRYQIDDRSSPIFGSLSQIGAVCDSPYVPVVLSNDTGPAHLITAVDNAPLTGVIYSPWYSPNYWRSSERQIPVEILPHEAASSGNTINAISPDRVATLGCDLLHEALNGR